MGIREAILILVVGAICVAALVRPRIGLYGYIWYALMRPDVLAFVDDMNYPFSVALAVATGLGSLPYLGRTLVIFKSQVSRTLLLLQVPILLSVLSAVRPELTDQRYGYYIRMMAVLFLVPILIQTEKELKELLLVMALSLGLVGWKFGIYGLIHGGVEFVGGYGGMMDDNNFVALAFAMIIPLCWYCRSMVSSKPLKLLLASIVLAAIAAVVMTSSRGGSIAMGLGLLMLLIRSKRKMVPAVLVCGCLAGAIYLVRATYMPRMDTLRDVQGETSAASRIAHAQTAVAMWKDYPLMGVGFGGLNYAELSPNYGEVDGAHVAHNSYLQMLVDSGIFAFGFYCWALFGAIRQMQRSAAWRAAHRPESVAIPLGIQIPLIVFALGSAFYSCQRMDIPYIFLMCAAALETVDRRERAESGDSELVISMPVADASVAAG